MKNIALFGGSFDPPHIGHELIVKALLELKCIDKIIIMPTFLNPFKSKFHAPSELRLKWLKEIFIENKNVFVDDFEVSLSRKVTSIESVNHLLKSYDKIFLVIGADNLSTLHKWHNFDKLNEKVTFIVATREGIKIPNNFITLYIEENISSSSLRKEVDKIKLPKKCAEEIAQYYKENNEK